MLARRERQSQSHVNTVLDYCILLDQCRMEQIHFPLFFKSKELYYALVKWRYVIPHIEGNKGGKHFLFRLDATPFSEYFYRYFSFINE